MSLEHILRTCVDEESPDKRTLPIMRQTMEINDFLNDEFWSGIYRGRSIALLNHSERWHVYLDHTLQHRYVFASARHAKAWLMRRIDEQCDVRAVGA
jgi:hypothetical protein